MTQTIEQLTSRVRELEEENARLKSLATTKGAMGLLADQLKQLAASQAYAEQLREALDVVSIAPLVNDCGLPKYGVSVSEMKLVQKALAIPHDTSALDAYVEQKVKEAEARTGNKSPCYQIARDMAVRMWERHYKDDAPNWQPLDDFMGVLSQISNMLTGLGNVEELTRQRDLAVEALEKALRALIHASAHVDNEDFVKVMIARDTINETLSTIKESEGK